MNIKNKKILIIEDDPDVRLATKMHLESAGYLNVSVAENGEAGLESIRKEIPALVLLDRKMPGRDGLQVLDEIKEFYGEDIEVVMLTAYREKDYITEAMRKGAFSYLAKDEDPDLMLHTIENALRYHEKSFHSKAIEREIYELLIENDAVFKNGYDFDYFKSVLETKIGDLVEGVIHTSITDCSKCTDLFCQNSNNVSIPPQLEIKLLSSSLSDFSSLVIVQRSDTDRFFQQTVNSFVEESRRHEVQTLVYVPFIEHSSAPLLRFLQSEQKAPLFIRYCCIYIFSTETLNLTPEEKRLLRGFFNRFFIAMRMAKLVDKIDSLNKGHLLGAMATMVVHQISPLIMPLMHCLQEFDVKKQEQGLAMIKDLRRMVDDFREYANGIVKEYHFAKINLSRIIQQAETLVALETAHHIEIHYAIEDAPHVVYGDADRLRQVFSNLLLNAVQSIAAACRHDGRIDIAIMTRENNAEVRIRDNGPGVPAEIVPELFLSYISTKHGGMGLGLSLAYEIVRRHGGKIEYNPQYAGGAEFIVKLPLVSADAANRVA